MVTVVKSMKTIGSKVDEELYDIFRLVCEKEGVTISERVKGLVKEFVEKEAPFIVLDQNVCQELKRIAKERGEDWKQMTCRAILGFCQAEKENLLIEIDKEVYSKLEAVAKKEGITVDQLARIGFKWFFEKEKGKEAENVAKKLNELLGET